MGNGTYASPLERDIPGAQEPLKPLTRNRGQWLFFGCRFTGPVAGNRQTATNIPA